MTWTDETITAEFRKALAYWQPKLRMADLDVRIRLTDTSERGEWCSVAPDNGGDNLNRIRLTICRDGMTDMTALDIWTTTAHELVHAMNWSMAHAFDPLIDQFAVAQLNMANALMKRGNEQLAYKWEQLLTTWFAADAPASDDEAGVK